MNDRFSIRIEKDLPFYFEIKNFGCQTKFFVLNSIITDSGFGWVERTRRFNLGSTQTQTRSQKLAVTVRKAVGLKAVVNCYLLF